MLKVDLRKVTALRGRVQPRSPEVVKWKKRAAQQWRSYHSKRFNRFSRGQGSWPNTQRRRAGKTKFILRKTHTLFRSLAPVFRNLPGQFEQLKGNYIRVGIVGGDHPEADITVGRLAAIHNDGEGRMPRRQIVVRLPKSEQAKMLAGLEKAIKKK